MVKAVDAVVWVNNDTKCVEVAPRGSLAKAREGAWGDPIGAAYAQWAEMNDQQRIQLLLETAIDLAAQGFDMVIVLKAFSNVDEFKALGSQSYPMCRALTKALVGESLEPNTMSFDELLVEYGERR
jgi:hypothetical protein